MRAELKGVVSPDADVRTLDGRLESLLVQLMIGPAQGPGEESFDAIACTPGWRARSVDPDDAEQNRYLIVLDRVDLASIEAYVREFLETLERPTWIELAAELDQIGKWEFLDYRP
ncbi:Imm8 family immunity protein [Nocardia sp. NPDC057353]|uniref:Imm8 family immunity protein n=1 Tax=Nocardia sp. NPDC057353 TaxID=3346104 RepID=UPI003627D23E